VVCAGAVVGVEGMWVVERARERRKCDSLRLQQGKKDEMEHAPQLLANHSLLLSSSLRPSRKRNIFLPMQLRPPPPPERYANRQKDKTLKTAKKKVQLK